MTSTIHNKTNKKEQKSNKTSNESKESKRLVKDSKKSNKKTNTTKVFGKMLKVPTKWIQRTQVQNGGEMRGEGRPLL